MTGQFVAEYLRLSVEDGDVVSNDIKIESDSIFHQRELIRQYIHDQQIYPDMQRLEFVDDGYSGTNFDRPGVQRMLSMVREGKICCIIVKDISRFGRNYLEVGDYLEQIFPFMRIRFIAVNDGYDSNDHIGTTGGIEIAFKSLLYDMYSRDLSEKMRSSLLVRRKRGDFIGPRAPFGYQFSDNKKVLAVDDVAAQYVKRIFALACEGFGTGKIAKKLNEEKVPTPGRYKNQKKKQYHILDEEGFWDSGRVRKVLQNKTYLGMVVNGKNRVTEIGGSHFRQVPENEQICVPGKHEAIISEEEFILASKVIKNGRCRGEKKYDWKQESVLLGKLRCGHCKRSLIRINCMKVPGFICKKAGYEESLSRDAMLPSDRREGKGKCIHERLSEPELEAAILECINQKLGQEIQNQKNQEQNMVSPVSDRKQAQQRCVALEKKRDSLKIEKQYLYEQFKRKQIERRSYLNKVETLREEEQNLCGQIQRIQEEQESCEESRKSQQKEMGCTERLEKLTKDVLDEWVDTIYVYGKEEFDIIYKQKIKNIKKV